MALWLKPRRCSTWPRWLLSNYHTFSILLLYFLPSVSFPIPINSLLVTLTCTLTNNDDPTELVGHQNLFFVFFNKDHLALQLSPLPFLTPAGTERERGRSNSKLRGRALLSALHQETECERAARHHTEAPLKIHVYHSSSFIDGLSSLYVYEVRGLPVALVSDP